MWPLQECEENPSFCYGSTKPRGVIFPQSSEEIPVFLVAKATGRLHQTLRIAIFCSTQPPLVSCTSLTMLCSVSECVLSNPSTWCALGGGLIMYWARTSGPCWGPTSALRCDPGSEGPHKNPTSVKPITHPSPLHYSRGTMAPQSDWQTLVKVLKP